MTEISLKSKLAWQCRRGMLELDVILEPFFQQHFDSLSAEQQTIFSLLLQEDDPDLYAWLMGFADCQDLKMVPLIELIRERNMNFD